MSLLFMDGMSHYATADIGRKWTVVNTRYADYTVTAEGRTDGCIKRVSNYNGSDPGFLNIAPTWTQSGVWTTKAEGVCGFALKVDDLSRIGGQLFVASVNTVNGGVFAVMSGIWTQFAVGINPDGTLTLWSGVAGVHYTALATTINALTSGLWSFLEFKWTINATTGSLIIRSRGIEILNYTGQLYAYFGPFAPPAVDWTSVEVMGQNSTPTPFLTMRMCDFYLLDQTGGHTDFLGDVSVSLIKPNGVGAASVWTPTPAVANYLNVNEVPPDDDTSYNATTTPGNIDSYEFEDLPSNSAPIALQQCILSRMTLPGTATIKSVVRPSAANFESPAQEVTNTSYAYNLFPYDTNPAAAAWSRTIVNGTKFGVDKVT